MRTCAELRLEIKALKKDLMPVQSLLTTKQQLLEQLEVLQAMKKTKEEHLTHRSAVLTRRKVEKPPTSPAKRLQTLGVADEKAHIAIASEAVLRFD